MSGGEKTTNWRSSDCPDIGALNGVELRLGDDLLRSARGGESEECGDRTIHQLLFSAVLRDDEPTRRDSTLSSRIFYYITC